MKKNLIFLLCVLVLISGLVACTAQGNSKSEGKQETTKTVSKTKKTTKKKDNSLTNMQQIGTDEVGYVYVPKDWVKFTDLNGEGVYQYSAVDGYTIITMSGYTKETLGVDVIDEVTVKQVADNYIGNMDETGNFEGLTGSKAVIIDYNTAASYQAYQVYGTSKVDGKLLCAWIFKTKKSDRVYLISLEGDKSSNIFTNQIAYVENSWSESKK